jgi:hypothetical protein
MESTSNGGYQTPFSTPHSCALYLFPKRWPNGFRCPFCDKLQDDMAPAETVVCRYCRKQTSISAGTVMHGSKKPLTFWIHSASMFCFTRNGLSSRALQQRLNLSCYQTAWSILQKLRIAAGLAETSPCEGNVIFEVFSVNPASTISEPIEIGCLIELHAEGLEKRKIILKVLEGDSSVALQKFLSDRVRAGSVLHIGDNIFSADLPFPAHCSSKISSKKTTQAAAGLYRKTEHWLNGVYRGTIRNKYLQAYLDEFCFRYNTSTWTDQLAVLDHLVSGLVFPILRRGKENFSFQQGELS